MPKIIARRFGRNKRRKKKKFPTIMQWFGSWHEHNKFKTFPLVYFSKNITRHKEVFYFVNMFPLLNSCMGYKWLLTPNIVKVNEKLIEVYIKWSCYEHVYHNMHQHRPLAWHTQSHTLFRSIISSWDVVLTNVSIWSFT